MRSCPSQVDLKCFFLIHFKKISTEKAISKAEP